MPCTIARGRGGPGCSTVHGPWWGERLYDPESERNGAQPLQAVIVDDGYALYAVRPDSGEDGPAGEVRVRELLATTPAAHARLWAFLLDQDLTRTITWDQAPLDEPLWLTLTDPRAVRDHGRRRPVGAARGRRRGARGPELRRRRRRGDRRRRRLLRVERGALPAVRERLRAHGRPPPTSRSTSADLGAAYLGGTTLRSLAAAGRVRELTPGAVARASAAFRGDVEPWCPEIF